MTDSPMKQLLAAVDSLDVDAVIALLTREAKFLTIDGQRAQGTAAVRELLSDFVAPLRATTHEVTAEWHEDDVWIAELDATYERTDGEQTGVLARVIVLRERPDGIADLRAYGAQAPLLTDPHGEQGGMRLGGRWIPPL
jgi:ketosteroid isomerase-like protein